MLTLAAGTRPRDTLGERARLAHHGALDFDMRRLACSLCSIFLATSAACGACNDACDEFVELSFVSAAMDGTFVSTAYTIVLDADGKIATCEIEVADADAPPVACQGDAEIWVTTASSEDESSSGGTPGTSPPRIVVRWSFAPETFDFVVRDASDTLLLSNTLSPAYNDQDQRACDGECRRFDQEVTLAG